LRNTGYLAFAETAKPALSFVLILVVARMLGRDGMGSYTVILTFTSLFELIATFGVGTMITRAIAAEPERFSFYVNAAIGVAAVNLQAVIFGRCPHRTSQLQLLFWRESIVKSRQFQSLDKMTLTLLV
jgi:O-antigen/teichoic acid export membrane protein